MTEATRWTEKSDSPADVREKEVEDTTNSSGSTATPNSESEQLTDFDGPNDPGNPKNWGFGKRVYHTSIPALYGFAV